jgi:hypothetical protein
VNHRALQSQVLLAAILSLFAGHARGQDTYLARWQAIHARQPQGVAFEISAAKSEFYSGELIPLQLSFASTPPKTFLADTRFQDRIGRMNGTEEFLVDPAAFTEDPMRGLPGQGGGMGGISGGPILLSETPFVFEKLLNEWVRFRRPSQYRIALLSRRVTEDGSGGRLELVSNILTLHIIPAPAAWVKQQIAKAVRVLDAPADPSQEAQLQRQRAGSTLRFLESPESALELVRHLDSGNDVNSWSLYAGVLGSPYRKQLLSVMEARLIAPDQPVWARYLDTLGRLSELVAPDGRRKDYAARLIASLPAKKPAARVVSMNTLLDSNGPDAADSAWIPAVAASLVADFHRLPSNLQINLIESRWNIIGGQAMLPLLREIYADPLEPQGGKDIAVRRIYELAPEEGRRIILSQLTGRATYLSLSTLEMLPDRSLPELNDVLASRLEAGGYSDALILRYATGDIVQRVEQAYLKRNADLDRQKLPHCGGPLIYYFLQQDPAFGEKELRSDMDKPGGFPACYDIGFQFQSLDRKAYSPALERLAIQFLASPIVAVKRGAAEVLGKYGSAAAQKPLWETLEYFRSWWKGREADLDGPDGQEGMQFERALRIALAQADGWTLQADGLSRLLDLCTSNWCKQEVREWLSRATSPVAIQITPGWDGFRATIAQYDTHSEEQMRSKIAQFPADTVFRVAPMPGGDNRARAAIEQAEQIVRVAGYALASQ